MRSDSRPHNGANRNCIAENDDSSRPSTTAPAWKCRPYRGSSGSTRPLHRYATDGTTRTDSLVDYQAFAGDRSPFTLKQWSDFDLLFRSVGDSAMTLYPRVNGNPYTGATISSTVQNGERRFVSGEPSLRRDWRMQA